MFAARGTCRKPISNIGEGKLSPQKGEIFLITDKLIIWKYFSVTEFLFYGICVC